MNEYENQDHIPQQEPWQSAQPQQEIPPQQPVSSAYHGTGTGRKESPYANSPYVMNHPPRQDHDSCTYHQPPQPEQAYHYQPQYESPKPKKQRKKKRKKILAAVLAVALVAGSWYYMMYTIHGMDFINNFLGVHNFLRATQSEHPRWDVWW